jgi:DNA-binding NarL/FixJ family response regulator
MKSGPIRVLCVDDHAVVVEGLKARLSVERDLEFVGQLGGAEGLVEEARRTRADVVVLDIEMPGPDPFEAARDLHVHCPDVRTIFLSAYLKDHFLDAAFESGAWGYIYKGDDLDAIVDGIRRVGRGQFFMGARVAGRTWLEKGHRRSARLLRSSRLKCLTPREVQILGMIGRGMSRGEIATATHRSVKTIDTHRAAIMEKLDIHDRTELALFAVREGLVEV